MVRILPPADRLLPMPLMPAWDIDLCVAYFWPSQAEGTKLAIGGSMLFIGNARVVTNLILAGTFDRHPSLKCVSVESGIGWIFGPKLGYTYCAELAVCAQSVSLIKALAPGLGLTISSSLSVSSAAPDYAAQCEALQQAKINSYSLGLVSNTALRVASQCKSQGFNVPAVISDGTITADRLKKPSLAGTAVVGSDVSYTENSTPAEKDFHGAIKQYQPNIGSLFGPNVTEGWVSGQLLAKAVEKSGASTITSSSIKEGLYALKGETLGGMTPALTYNAGKASPVNCFIPETISGGQLATANGSTTECAPDALVAAISAKL